MSHKIVISIPIMYSNIYSIQSTIKYKIASWLTLNMNFYFFVYCDNAAVVSFSAEDEYIKENAPIDTDAYKKLKSNRYYKGIFIIRLVTTI